MGESLERLWSPHRFAYVAGERPPGCVFCEVQERVDGPENLVLRRETHALLMLNLYPYNNGHALVVPRRHVEQLSELTAEETAGMWDLVARTADLLRDPLRAQGVNVGVNLGLVSGASIEHLHVHLVPRWSGDTNFMPIIAGTKVMVETVADTYARFAQALTAWGAEDTAEAGDV